MIGSPSLMLSLEFSTEKMYLQKLLFLTQKRLAEQDISTEGGYGFIAYDYGPFSKEIYEDTETLIDRGLVSERTEQLDDGVVKYNYEITEQGQDLISRGEIAKGDTRRTVEEVWGEFSDTSLQSLIDYVYSEYPEYAENSVLY